MGEEEIGDDDLLYRRLIPWGVTPDGTLSSAIYMRSKPRRPDPEISVDLATLTTPEQTLDAGPPGFGLGVLKVSEVRKLGFTVRRAPSRDNPAHCIIEGVETKGDCDRLARITQIQTPPSQPNQ